MAQSTSSMVPATPSSSESSDHDPCLSNNDEPVTVSLLSMLKSPPASEFGRKRKIRANAPPTGKRRSRGTSTIDLKKVQPHQRVREFPSEPFKANANKKLFCVACREELCLKLSSIRNHVQSVKHKGVKKMELKEARQKDIADVLKRHNEATHARGETLPDNQQIYRIKVATCFLRAGVLISKIVHFRDLLEENAFRVSDRRHMSDLIPFILKEEQERIKAEISGRPVSVIFDGTTRLGEALAVVLRYVADDWSIQQRLVCLQLLAKSLTGEEIACELVKVISTVYGIDSNRLLASMRDGASSNGVAIRTLKIVYPKCMDIICFSHTIDRVGSHFHTPILDEFVSAWISMFSHSPKARLCWKELTGRSMASYSPTRWWSKWELMNQLLMQFGDIERFLTENSEIAPASNKKLLDILRNSPKSSYLKLELSSIIDWGENFVKATYTLEGDGPLCFKCYEVIDSLLNAIHSAHCPNVTAVLRNLVPTTRISALQMTQYARNCIQPGLDYFKSQIDVKVKDALLAFKAARLFSPHKVDSMKPTASDLDCLSAFPFFDANFILKLKSELPTYLSKCADTERDYCVLQWWKQNSLELPYWAEAARKALLVQPSSAASERVFSMLKATFNEQQDTTLQDYLEASLMLQYNNR